MSTRFADCAAEPISGHDGAPLLQRAGSLLRITLNRPAEHNRLDPADIEALLPLLDTWAQDGDTRALVITGSGEATFSSGYTLQAIVDELDDRLERMLDAIEQLPFPTIAACNGSVYGGATDLALCCDFRIGVPGMKMFMPAARFGMHYYPGGLRRYLTRLGLPAASKLMLTGMTIEADEMLRIGFLTELVTRDAFDERVDNYLEHIVRTDAGVVAGMKRHLLEMAHAGLETAAGRATLASMSDAYQESLQSDELRNRLAQLAAKKH